MCTTKKLVSNADDIENNNNVVEENLQLWKKYRSSPSIFLKSSWVKPSIAQTFFGPFRMWKPRFDYIKKIIVALLPLLLDETEFKLMVAWGQRAGHLTKFCAWRGAKFIPHY